MWTSIHLPSDPLVDHALDAVPIQALRDDVEERPAHRLVMVAGIMGLDERVVADRSAGQGPMTATGSETLARLLVPAQHNELFERSRIGDALCVRDQVHPGRVVLA